MNVNCEELISKVKEFGGIMEKIKKPVDDFQKQLEDFKSDADKKFKRVENGKKYYCVVNKIGTFVVAEYTEHSLEIDKIYFKENNYFFTRERAQEVADRLNKIMCIERIIDEFPEYEIKTYIHAFVPDPDTAQKLRDRLREKLNLTK